MKISLNAFLGCAVLATFLSACDPGTLEYGYAYNPKGVVYRMVESLRASDFTTDWGILFSGKMTCYYSSDEGIALLKKTIGKPETALQRLSLEQPVLIRTGRHIRGSNEVMGSILLGEEYRVRVIQNSTGEPVMTLTLSCFKERSGGSIHQSCSVTQLENHVYGNPSVPVCEGL